MNRNQHPVDDFFRNALKDNQIVPSDSARERFLQEASTLPEKGRGIRYYGLFILAALAITGTLAVILFPSQQERSVNPLISNPATSSQTATSGGPSAEPVSGPAIESASTPVSTSTSTSSSSSSSSSASASASASASEPDRTPVSPDYSVESPEHALSPDQAPTHATTILASTEPDRVSETGWTESSAPRARAYPVIPQIPSAGLAGTTSGSLPDIRSDSGNIRDTLAGKQPDTSLQTPHPASEKSPAGKASRPGKWNPAVSLGYAPEWMLNTLEGTKYVNNFLIEGSIRKDRYLLRAGAGISWTEGANELLVEYNDYLGSYNRLDSMSFHWDTKHYYLLPTYYTSDQEVWDSLMKADYPTVQKRYTYLQIPVIFGYEVISRKHFSFGIRAGQILSILIGEKQLTPDYDPMKNRVIQVNNITVDRIESNWQILAGVNASWHINRRLTLEFEPLVRYYFTSVYEQSDISKKVWSVGFRTAITFGK